MPPLLRVPERDLDIEAVRWWDHYTYGVRGSNRGGYPAQLPGVRLPMHPPNPPNTNCVKYVEAVVIGACVRAGIDVPWTTALHNDFMIRDPTRSFSPVEALQAIGLATRTEEPAPHTVVQLWRVLDDPDTPQIELRAGHLVYIRDYHAPTDKVLLWEANCPPEVSFNGPGIRGFGHMAKVKAYHGSARPVDWWENPEVPCWADLLAKRPHAAYGKVHVARS